MKNVHLSSNNTKGMRILSNDKGFNYLDPLDFDNDFTVFIFNNTDLVPIMNKLYGYTRSNDISYRIILRA